MVKVKSAVGPIEARAVEIKQAAMKRSEGDMVKEEKNRVGLFEREESMASGRLLCWVQFRNPRNPVIVDPPCFNSQMLTKENTSRQDEFHLVSISEPEAEANWGWICAKGRTAK